MSSIICELYNGQFSGTACPCVLDETDACQLSGQPYEQPQPSQPTAPPTEQYTGLCSPVHTGNYFADIWYNGVMQTLCFTSQVVSELSKYGALIGASLAFELLIHRLTGINTRALIQSIVSYARLS